MSTGSKAANAHEGSRSEYLAQYVFAAFGTAFAVPHQEDTGIDLYCTLTERIGQRAWPRAHYTVQVKSSERPRLRRSPARPHPPRPRRPAGAWEFDGAESVRWLLEHPLPLFLCIVDKKQAHLRVYKTHARFAANFPDPPPALVRLHPGTPHTFVQTADLWDLPLREPILESSIGDLLDDKLRRQWHRVLTAWVAIEDEAIARSRRGVKSVLEPKYTKNCEPDPNTTGTSSAGLALHAAPELVKFLEEFSAGYQSPDGVTETLICMLHRQLTSEGKLADRGLMMASHLNLNELLKATGHACSGADSLIETIRFAVKTSDRRHRPW